LDLLEEGCFRGSGSQGARNLILACRCWVKIRRPEDARGAKGIQSMCRTWTARTRRHGLLRCHPRRAVSTGLLDPSTATTAHSPCSSTPTAVQAA
uniref:Uncharacterized protein n=1 Tax=Triticum urartu TaxID=4572 RepID=A0A8R7V2N6_TRIUA